MVSMRWTRRRRPFKFRRRCWTCRRAATRGPSTCRSSSPTWTSTPVTCWCAARTTSPSTSSTSATKSQSLRASFLLNVSFFFLRKSKLFFRFFFGLVLVMKRLSKISTILIKENLWFEVRNKTDQWWTLSTREGHFECVSSCAKLHKSSCFSLEAALIQVSSLKYRTVKPSKT